MTLISENPFLSLCNATSPFILMEQNGWVRISTGKLVHLENLDDIHHMALRENCDIGFALPYHCIRERGFEAKGDEPILAMQIDHDQKIRTNKAVDLLPNTPITLDKSTNETGVTPSMSDDEYAAMVKDFQDNEIEAGNASQVTLSRRFEGKITDFSLQSALSIFRKLCLHRGHYMAVLFADIHPDDPAQSRFIIGATPERHLQVTGNKTIMIPIAGTLRKDDRETFPERLNSFVTNPKEVNELYQVVDEEMKIMGKICPHGGDVRGPFLREIGAVVHTEYELIGQRCADTIDALRHSLHAPTVVGSPMESAARIIAKYEPISRRYYAGEFGYYSRPHIQPNLDDENTSTRTTTNSHRAMPANGDLDSAILIRCGEIFGDGRFAVQSGGGLVRDSIPLEEAKESTAKANGFINILTATDNADPANLPAPYLTDELRRQVAGQLAARNTHLSDFWFKQQPPSANQKRALKDMHITIVNNEDDFAHMIGHALKNFGIAVTIMDTFDYHIGQDHGDITILGPGPGDPNDKTHPRMKKLHDIADDLRRNNRPCLGVCLGHQTLAINEGITVARQAQSSQGMQKSIHTFNTPSRLGFYNSFSPVYDPQMAKKTDIRMDVDENNRIIAMQGSGFIGFQFHPESIMSENGIDLLYKALVTLRFAL